MFSLLSVELCLSLCLEAYIFIGVFLADLVHSFSYYLALGVLRLAHATQQCGQTVVSTDFSQAGLSGTSFTRERHALAFVLHVVNMCLSPFVLGSIFAFKDTRQRLQQAVGFMSYVLIMFVLGAATIAVILLS